MTCARCDEPAYLTAYWGEPLCRTHVHEAVTEHDRGHSWPEEPSVT